MADNYVITIARGFGSGGKEIGCKLAARQGIPCYERQILDMASEYSGVSKTLFAEVDEKLRGGFAKAKLRGYPTTLDVVEATEKRFTSDVNLFNIQAKIIRELARTESCIIIGKCADWLLRDYDNVVSVYIEAPRAACVRSVMDKLCVEESEAHTMIYHTDKYRAEYYKYYSGGGEWTNPINYDMTLNSDRIGRDCCVDLIEQYLHIKGLLHD